ncbi:NAD(P)/FAD-dependent oxidoreductase [Desulfopila sp. IMCC35008]|uniref:dihydrolipoyl dehydrogenase family protein n=1 Tax=Desulfopila sp. IMCC35008 TaxID=2653858 RepID=UPI001F110D2B|nr:NAD(P)/FAD-dependent oxidoreductase [Desulfopila sp. IMCC35008]
MEKYDVIVIGTGTAGQTAAFDLAAEGHSVAIIESSNTPGGVCALHGCQAKKWFYEVSEIVARCNHLQDMGITTLPRVDWQQILIEKNTFTSKVPENTINNLRGNGTTFIEGQATFIDKFTVSVNNSNLKASAFIVATGAKPMILPFEGNEYMITSDEFLELKTLPGRVAFIGGGFISFEFAHFTARLGCRKGDVYILEAKDKVLSPFDQDMVRQLVEASETEGINIQTNVSIVSIQRSRNGYTVVLESGADLEVDLIVNGAGRAPNIDSLNLPAAGVEFSRKGITVDQHMKTSADNIFAIGDCAESLQFARVADMEAHVAARSIIDAKNSELSASIDYSATPSVLFTYPQLGFLGKTEEQLKEENINYWKSYDTHLSWPTYRRVGLKYAAYKIMVDKNDLILGAHFISDNTTGLLNTFKQAMIDKVPVTKLYENNIMTPYPSRESDILYMLGPFVE